MTTFDTKHGTQHFISGSLYTSLWKRSILIRHNQYLIWNLKMSSQNGSPELKVSSYIFFHFWLHFIDCPWKRSILIYHNHIQYEIETLMFSNSFQTPVGGPKGSLWGLRIICSTKKLGCVSLRRGDTTDFWSFALRRYYWQADIIQHEGVPLKVVYGKKWLNMTCSLRDLKFDPR